MTNGARKNIHNHICVVLMRAFKVSVMKWLGAPYMPPRKVQAYKCRLCGIEIFADKENCKEKSEWVNGGL